MKSGKYWLDVESMRVIEIDETVTGLNGDPVPPMDCILGDIDVVDDLGGSKTTKEIKYEQSKKQYSGCDRMSLLWLEIRIR